MTVVYFDIWPWSLHLYKYSIFPTLREPTLLLVIAYQKWGYSKNYPVRAGMIMRIDLVG